MQGISAHQRTVFAVSIEAEPWHLAVADQRFLQLGDDFVLRHPVKRLPSAREAIGMENGDDLAAVDHGRHPAHRLRDTSEDLSSSRCIRNSLVPTGTQECR